MVNPSETQVMSKLRINCNNCAAIYCICAGKLRLIPPADISGCQELEGLVREVFTVPTGRPSLLKAGALLRHYDKQALTLCKF